MGVVLIANPAATNTNATSIRKVLRHLGDDVEVHWTAERGHATELAKQAVADEAAVVAALGGDGTSNEVLQSLVHTPVLFCPLPGGSANVFARALGLPNDLSGAARRLAAGIQNQDRRTINLGAANGRFFAFAAGLGFDAEVVRAVERHETAKRRYQQLAFVGLALHTYLRWADRRSRLLTVEVEGKPATTASIAIVANADPYTFLGPRPLRLIPRASFERDLDVLMVDPVGLRRLLAIVGRAFTDGGHITSPHVSLSRDQGQVRISAPKPLPLHVDGDDIGDETEVLFQTVRDAITIPLAPPKSTT